MTEKSQKLYTVPNWLPKEKGKMKYKYKVMQAALETNW
jgi:hypothetical protein